MSVKFETIAAPGSFSDEKVADQVDRIVRSDGFHGSEILRNLLSYLAARAFDGRGEPIRAKEIATEVFGRREDFDSQTDSVVRVHTGRLRSKLAEYYMGEGSEDDLIVSIPKGTYAIAWHTRSTGARHSVAVTDTPNETEPQAMTTAEGAGARFRHVPLPLAIAVEAVAVVCTWAAVRLPAVHRVAKHISPGLQTFWHSFADSDQPPLIVFSNLDMVDSGEEGLHYRGAGDKGKPVIDTYTTAGEVMGVFELGQVLSQFGKTARVKRGELLTWDDAKDCDLIFIGGPLAKTPLRQISIFTEFQFEKSKSGANTPHPGSIISVHPRQGESASYAGSPQRPFSVDYAVIASRPAFSSGHRAVAIAGITEYGTWGAAEFVTQEETVNELLSRLGVKHGGTVPNFEALLKVRIEGGVPVQSELLLVHTVK
jgi:hypothetical protein